MAYTVKELAALSGISVRTLHYYDEINLLKPAHLSDANYRYYEHEQLLMLQQILFYRELGVPLKAIAQIIKSSDFDKLAALKQHQLALEQLIEQKHVLLNTVKKTINHLEKDTDMKPTEYFSGFDKALDASLDKMIKTGITTPQRVQEAVENPPAFLADYENQRQQWFEDGSMSEADLQQTYDFFGNMSLEQHQQWALRMQQNNTDLLAALSQGLAPDSEHVQQLIHENLACFGDAITTNETVIASQLKRFTEDSALTAELNATHPGYCAFMAAAMRAYFNLSND